MFAEFFLRCSITAETVPRRKECKESGGRPGIPQGRGGGWEGMDCRGLHALRERRTTSHSIAPGEPGIKNRTNLRFAKTKGVEG